MIIDLPRSDAQPTGRKLARQALLLTRVSVIALTTALMPFTLGGFDKPLVAKAAFAQSADDDGTADQGSGDAPGTPSSGGAGDDDGTADQGHGDDGQDHDVGDDHGDDGDGHDVGDDHGGGEGGEGGDGGNSGSGSNSSGSGGGEGGGGSGGGEGGGSGSSGHGGGD
ncbi:MAG: hypothetical protein ACREFM_04925 [Hypericibacter sp.]